jgi:cobalt/nickel transport system ATP-binding protein
MSRNSVLRVDGLHYAYPDGTVALRDVTFALVQGERLALLGPNGAGKSTLMLHFNGTLTADAGDLSVDELSMQRSNLAAIRQCVGMVFQNPDDQLFCNSLAEDVAFGPRHMRLPDDQVELRVNEALTAVGLAGLEQRSPMHLSFGEKKRAAVATVLSMRPNLLVLDEQTANLDPRGRREMIQLLARLEQTVVIATHDLDLARQLCGRAIVLSRGQLVADRSTAELLSDESFLLEHGLA